MFEQAFKNIDNILRREAGCATEFDYTEQMSWLLFLKYLDDLENHKAAEALLQGRPYTFILDRQYRWQEWTSPSRNDLFDLPAYVNYTLFPYLQRFRHTAPGLNTIEHKIGEIFSQIHNKFLSDDNLREAIYHIDMLRFDSEAEKHELLELYEAKIRNMGNASRNGGECYTPRPLIRAMLQVVQPQLGEHIYDGACGSAGFLCESVDYLKSSQNFNTNDPKVPLTLLGKEKKSFAYVVAIMNMILHGIEAPNIIHTNPLMEFANIQDKDRFEVILSNPPFGGKERGEVQYNFPIPTKETSFLFLQHFLKMLKPGGRAGVVVPRRFLSSTNNVSVDLRQMVLESCNLHTVLDCPSGTFQGCDLRTAVLFFEKGRPTRKVWFYQLDPGRNLTKAKPLNDNDLAEFVMLQKTFADSPKSWSVDVMNLDKTTFALAQNESRAAKSKNTIKEGPLKVFICHGSEDKPAIRELYNRLQGDGVKPWLDERDILPGQDWNEEIKRAARSSDIILVCLSSTSVGKSGYVQKEIKFALDMADEKPEGTIFIVPVKLGDCVIPERLARWQWVQYSETDGYEKIMRTLRARAEQCGLKAPGEKGLRNLSAPAGPRST